MATRGVFLPHRLRRPRPSNRLLDGVQGHRTIDLRTPLESSATKRMAKRGIDLTVGCVALVAVLPVAVLIAVAILIESPGAPLFVHRRVGRSGREFAVLKFRTMVRDAERRLDDFLEALPGNRSEWERTQKLRRDPRVTRVGRVLRRCSLDELPQLLNVIRGDMSLVGPRPVLREEMERFGAHGTVVLAVRPGMTGLWAVSGRTEVSYQDRVLLESRYVREWSLLLDVRILVKTIPRVVGCSGAY